MPQHPFAVIATLCAALAFVPLDAPAQSFEPQIGQAGKDVIWVPTPNVLVARMLDMAKATPQDYLVDLGSGDGRTVIAAAKRGIKALGIEYNADMVALSNRNAEAAGVADRVKFIQGDIFKTDFSQATVVTMYLLSSLNLKLQPILLNMKPGTRIVSHAFTMGDWKPDEAASVEGYSAYLWIVPAKVQGRWQINGPAGRIELALDQTFQKISGKVSGPNLSPDFKDPLLQGDSLAFTLIDASGQPSRFKGTVNGDSMEGTVQTPGKPDARWTGRRAR